MSNMFLFECSIVIMYYIFVQLVKVLKQSCQTLDWLEVFMRKTTTRLQDEQHSR